MSFAPEADRLQVWLFGPGVGELVVMHVPPDGWLSVDGCAVGGAGFGLQFFEPLGIAPTHVLLSHPHQDHCAGVQELVEWSTRAGVSTWPLLGAIPWPRSGDDKDDGVAVVTGAQAKGALAAMSDRWKRRPECRWSPAAGQELKLGGGALKVLSPDAATLAAAQKAGKGDWNKLACALEVAWQGQRLILGSDLDNAGWKVVLENVKLEANAALKVAHHGSRESQHEPLLELSKGTFVATPYSRQRLPRFEDGGGAQLLLEKTSVLWLTGLPQKYDAQGGAPRTMTRGELAVPVLPAADDAPKGFPDSWVKLSLGGDGAGVVTQGPGSVAVTP